MNRHRTKIVCTLGPASDSEAMIRRMIRAGARVFRLNASHGNAAEHAARIRRVRRVARGLGQPVGVLMDLPGPKLRLSELPGGERSLRKGDVVYLTGGPQSRLAALPLRNPKILRDLRTGHEVFLADGTVRLRVEARSGGAARCRVLVGGTVRSGSGVNLPDTELSGAVPTPADRKWARFARRQGADWVAVSFVQRAADLRRVRRLLGRERGAPRLIAKIEKRGAVKNLEEIIEAADGVMVARGDLGVETPLAEVPVEQKRIIASANRKGRPVITATQMLESMVENPSPTRAEVADVANAILDGTDGVMLSAEAAIGRYPVEATATLSRVSLATEAAFPFGSELRKFAEQDWTAPEAAIAYSAARLAADSAAQAILIDPAARTRASDLARFRTRAPIVALCHHWEEACRETLAWGVEPLVVPPAWKQAIPAIRRTLQRNYGFRPGSRVVLVQSAAGLYGEGSDLVRIVQF